MGGELQKLCSAVQRCSLTRLQVTGSYDEILLDKILHDSFNHILANTELLQDTGELVFTEYLDNSWE